MRELAADSDRAAIAACRSSAMRAFGRRGQIAEQEYVDDIAGAIESGGSCGSETA
jgi:hypothetical protein